MECPVICKLTDFGESRSTLPQTASIIHAKTMNIERGTKPYMVPEIILEGKLNCVTMEDLKAIDIWALGMIVFSSINPDVDFPYEIELNSSTEKLYLKCTAFDSFPRPHAEDVLMELNGNGERKPSALSRDVSLEEKVNDKPASLSGETTVWLLSLNERELSKPGRAFFCVKQTLGGVHTQSI